MFSPYAHRRGPGGREGRACPVLVTVHSMWSGAGGLLRVASLAGLRRWPVAWSAVSSVAAETFSRSLGGVTVAVLPNAVDVAELVLPRRRSASARPPVSDPVTLISVMRLMPRKRPLQLVRMFEQVRELTTGDDVRLVVVGDGPLRRRMERYVQRHGLTEHVHLTGRLTRTEVHASTSPLPRSTSPPLPRSPSASRRWRLGASGCPWSRTVAAVWASSCATGSTASWCDGDAEMTVALADLVRDRALRTRIAVHNRLVRARVRLGRRAGADAASCSRSPPRGCHRATPQPAPVMVPAVAAGLLAIEA